MAYLSVVNWDEFQHYKDRNPPWIKLHNQLLENYEFECLPDASKAHLLCIWMLASRTANKIKPDPEWISRKIGANTKVDVSILVESGFLELNQEDSDRLQNASTLLQTTEQNAIPEERRGEESKEEEENKKPSSSTPNLVMEIFSYWCEVMNKSPGQTKLTSKRDRVIRARLKDGYSIQDIKTAIDNCRRDPFSMGANNRNKPFNDIELICRTGEKLESFRDFNPNGGGNDDPPKGGPNAASQRPDNSAAGRVRANAEEARKLAEHEGSARTNEDHTLVAVDGELVRPQMDKRLWGRD